MSAIDEAQMVLVGKEDWLFLQNDINNTIAQVQNLVALPSSFDDKWVKAFRSRVDRYQSKGIKCLFGIAPMKEVVYSEFLPDHIKFSAQRPVHRVINAAAAVGMPIYYPERALRDLAHERAAYPTGDTHWTSAGAYVAYANMLRAIGRQPISLEEVVFTERFVTGDLASKIGGRTMRYENHLASPKSHAVFDNEVVGTGNVKIFENEFSSQTCVVFRDSFTVYAENMFRESFGKTVLVWQPNLESELIDRFKPDFILSLMAERFLTEPPDDENDPANAEIVARKRAGQTRLIQPSKM